MTILKKDSGKDYWEEFLQQLQGKAFLVEAWLWDFPEESGKLALHMSSLCENTIRRSRVPIGGKIFVEFPMVQDGQIET
ncbi:hypothetical protein ACTXT7_002848 [Hymenolepis weldensis]